MCVHVRKHDVKIQAADNAGLLALSVNNKCERPRSLLTHHQETAFNLLHFCGNARRGRVSESGLTGAISEVTSDAAIGCSSAPPLPHRKHNTALPSSPHFCHYVIEARFINRTFYLRVCALRSRAVGAFRGCHNRACGCAHAHVWPFHNALGQAQVYCTEPCALR